MVKTYIIQDIKQDSRFVTPIINGKIIKVVIKSNDFMPEVRVKIRTNENEKIIDTTLDSDLNVYYPYNVLNVTHPESFRYDYFYSDGPLGLEIRGLKEGNVISFIKIFYE